MDLTVDVQHREGYAVVVVAGEVDMHTAPTLRERLVETVGEGHDGIVVDLEGVEFFDSTGLGVLIGAAERVEGQGGSFQVVCATPAVLRVFTVTGLIDRLHVHGSLEEAFSSGSNAGSDTM